MKSPYDTESMRGFIMDYNIVIISQEKAVSLKRTTEAIRTTKQRY